jgi:hypothetical protein
MRDFVGGVRRARSWRRPLGYALIVLIVAPIIIGPLVTMVLLGR